MSIKVWITEGKVEEYTVYILGKRETILAFPYRWFTAEIYNEGPDPVRGMINDQPATNAFKLSADQAREFKFDAPTIKRIALENDAGQSSTVKITVTR